MKQKKHITVMHKKHITVKHKKHITVTTKDKQTYKDKRRSNPRVQKNNPKYIKASQRNAGSSPDD